MSTDSKPPLRLLAQGLLDPDLAKITAFLRIGRGTLSADWQLVFDGDAHVMMVGGDEPATVAGLLDNPVVLLSVIDADPRRAGLPDVLQRPIQYEPLIAALADAERQLGRRPSDDARPHAVTAASAASAASAATAATAVASPAAPVPPTVATIRRSAALDGTPSDALSNGCFRLRRWPPAAVLQGHRSPLRLATLLSSRPLGVQELARLGQVEPIACEAFLAELLAHGLLERSEAAPGPAAAAVSPGAASAFPATAATSALPATAGALGTARPARPAPPPGLFGRIRRSLGIVWGR